MKRVYVSLTTKDSIKNAINELERYKHELEDKEELFCRRLADIGVNAAMRTLATKGQGDSDRSASFNITYEGDNGVYAECILTITSKPVVIGDDRAVFYPHLAWEFGAGNYFNGGIKSPNPKAGELGLGPGTFPDQTHVPEPGFWYYRDKHGDPVRSYGTQATMPMHTAVVEMMKSVETIAREIYRGK